MKGFFSLGKTPAYFIFIIGLLFAACTNSPEQSTPATLSDLHTAAPASGWVESQGAYVEFGDTGVFNVLYDSIYLMNNALKGGFRTTYTNAAETTTVTGRQQPPRRPAPFFNLRKRVAVVQRAGSLCLFREVLFGVGI
jgi:hypothetical protein